MLKASANLSLVSEAEPLRDSHVVVARYPKLVARSSEDILAFRYESTVLVLLTLAGFRARLP